MRSMVLSSRSLHDAQSWTACVGRSGGRCASSGPLRVCPKEQLGERADLHWTHISGIERAQYDLKLSTLTRVSRGLGVRLAALFAGIVTPRARRKRSPSVATGDRSSHRACRSRIRHQAAAGSWTMPRQWEIQRTWLNSARAAVRSPAKPNGV